MQHGWLNLNKPEEMTSAKAVSIVKRLLGVKKVGHTGTLDPLACGVLPLAIGEATKLSQYVMADRKNYRFRVEWGKQTGTDDREGEVIAQSDNRPTLAQVQAILSEFTGEIMQRPPDFSAIKVAGERSYKKAREGKKVDLPARPVTVYELHVEESSANEVTFTVICGKGTYVRSLARDMGEKLGCYGYVTFLQRSSVGIFDLKSAVSLDLVEEGQYALPLDFGLMSIDEPLDDILALRFKPDQLYRLNQGQSASPLAAAREFRDETVLRCYNAITGEFAALGRPSGSLVKPTRVFNLGN
ncbi:MAG: tRNA pseudouridine(55) synthase TruB [Rickettsiales bacterium]|nr:tRNA pseudouridine(55) synthase TruB [Rickettsiales bacterium]